MINEQSPWQIRSLVAGALCGFTLFAAGSLGAIATANAEESPARQDLPNVVVIVVQGLGSGELSSEGHPFHETPRLDELARVGGRFTAAYSASSVSAPSRAAVLTGNHPARLRLTDSLPAAEFPSARRRVPDWQRALPSAQLSLAQLLRGAGYQTAIIGGWQLGNAADGLQAFGFQRNLGGTDDRRPPNYFAPYHNAALPDGPAGESLTDRETAEAIKFIDDAGKRPFFLYLPRFSLQTPWQPKPALLEKYRRKLATAGNAADTKSVNSDPVFAAMLEDLDTQVGRLLDHLQQRALREKTIVVLTSDHGPSVAPAQQPPTKSDPSSTTERRRGRGSAYDAGVHVPLFISWPGKIPAETVIAAPVSGLDLVPTVLELTQAKNPILSAIPSFDGQSLAGALSGKQSLPSRNLYWHYPHYSAEGATPFAAIRAGNWRLIEFAEDERVELYDLEHDPHEQNDLANQDPERVNQLLDQLHAWQTAVGAQLTTPNPDWDGVLPLAKIHPAADGSILLHCRDAQVHGKLLRYEPQPHKTVIGYWMNVDDWASWNFQVTKPGTFRVQLMQGCGKDCGGNDVELLVGTQVLKIKVEETGGFQTFVTRDIGQLKFDRPGRYTLEVRPRNKTNVAIMDIRQIQLVPVEAASK